MVWLSITILGVFALILHEVEHAPLVDDSYELRLWEEVMAERLNCEKKCIHHEDDALSRRTIDAEVGFKVLG